MVDTRAFPLPAPFHERALLRALRRPLERALALDGLEALHARARGPGGPGAFVRRALDALEVALDVDASDLARLPSRGAAVVVCNHPHGILDGLALGELLLRVRPDVKVLANDLLGAVAEVRDLVIPVDVLGAAGAAGATGRNIAAVKAALEHLERGGLLAVFPSGEVSSFDLRRGAVADPAWSPVVARIARRAGCPVVPLRLEGRNGAAFQVAGLVHPRLRTALLPRALLGKRGATVRVRVGEPVTVERLLRCADDAAAIALLRGRVELLARRAAPGPAKAERGWFARRPADVASPGDPRDLAAEVKGLGEEAVLARQGELVVLEVARAMRAPLLIREVGRLREVAFRAAGEGTGRALDLDGFDATYRHLVAWSPSRREVTGAYRIGATDELGPDGLYTRTLFGYDARLLGSLGPALELGRSFVRPEDQRGPTLALLWRAIGRLIARAPRYRRLFGAVSVSADYAPTSRALIAGHLVAHSDPLAALVRSPRPPRAQDLTGVDLACEAEVDALVTDLEGGRRGLPVLVRQYRRLGARLLGLSVDPDFAGVTDGLMVVDLARTDRRILERTMGREEARAFLRRHAPLELDPTPDLDPDRLTPAA